MRIADSTILVFYEAACSPAATKQCTSSDSRSVHPSCPVPIFAPSLGCSAASASELTNGEGRQQGIR